MHEIRSEAAPWWLVPNLLALDAPLVAVVWQRFLASRFGGVVPVAASLALAAVVWCVYLADRRLDARRGEFDADRHRTAARFARPFAVAAVLAAAFAAAAAATLPTAYVTHGLAVGLGVAGYLAVVHGAGGRRTVGGTKELLVGVGFAAGVAVPLSTGAVPWPEWLPSASAFGGLCWLNCRLIDRWESARPRRIWAEVALGGALTVAATRLPAGVGLAVASSVGGLLAVHLACRGWPRAARVLADAVLLSPLAFWGVP